MDRQVFVSSVACGAIALALAANAQTPPNPHRPRRIGWLQGGPPDPPDQQHQVDDALAEVGWIVGQNVLIDRRYVRPDDLPRTAQDLVNTKVGLIVANGTAATLAAKNATSTIPMLMSSAGDPVAAGLVASLARPGGNVTGYALLSPEVNVKRLSLLRELLPAIRRVGELDESTNPALGIIRQSLEEAYRSLGMEPIFFEVANAGQVEHALAELVQKRVQALHIRSDALPKNAVEQIFGTAISLSLPTIVNGDDGLLEAGALMSYDVDLRELLRRIATFADKLLRGTKPADLPVEQLTKFSLAINLRTAKAIGITIPRVLLLRADKLIQ
jgi:putative ABC transport system substrate-binding protein